MFDSIFPFRKDKKIKQKTKDVSKTTEKVDLDTLNIVQFFSQRTGIGSSISRLITKYSGYSDTVKFNSLYNKNTFVLSRYKDFFISKLDFLDYSMIDEKRKAIKKLISINCYKGKRHKDHYTVRGQRLKTNAKTASKLNYL